MSVDEMTVDKMTYSQLKQSIVKNNRRKSLLEHALKIYTVVGIPKLPFT
jgi:hypothetical protein